MRACSSAVVTSGVALHVDRVDGAARRRTHAARSRGRTRRRSPRRSRWCRRTPNRPTISNCLAAPLSSTRTWSPTAEPVLLRGAGIHRHLLGTVGGMSVGEPERAPSTHDTPKVGGPPPPIVSPVASTNWASDVCTNPCAVRTPGTAATWSVTDVRDPAGVGRRLPRAEAPHLEVDAGEGLGEDRLERPLHRVGEHVGGADEADPEQDRQRGQGESHLSGEESPDRRLPHWADRSLLGPIMAAKAARSGAPGPSSRSARCAHAKNRPSGLKH